MKTMATSYPAMESKKPMEHTFLFLCGLHRSGRSVLHRILRGHPQISGFHNTGVPDDEGENLQNVYPKSRNYGGVGKFCFSPDAYLTEKSRLVTDDNRVRLFAQWQPYWDLERPFLMEKSAPNLVSSRFLQAMFPNSVFVFLVRHPVAVALATDKGALDNIALWSEHWAIAHKTMLADRAYLKRHILIRYEDMIARTDHTLRVLYEFLKLPYQSTRENVLQGINKEYFKMWEDWRMTRPRAVSQVAPFSPIASQFHYSFDSPYVQPMEIDAGLSL